MALKGDMPRENRVRCWLGSWALIVLCLHSACVTTLPRGNSPLDEGRRELSRVPRAGPGARGPTAGVNGTAAYDVRVFEPGLVANRPIPIRTDDFQRTLQRLARDEWVQKSPQEAARQLLAVHSELEGEWLAEVYRGRVLTLVPVDKGSLAPEAEEALRTKYLSWCEARGEGDCLHLFDDGPYLRADDRRTLALAMAFGSVLDETHAALGRELNANALVAMALWTVALYMGMWLLPEPGTKAVAAALTALLVAWLGIDTVWGLMDGWVKLSFQSYDATTFEELRAAGAEYGQILGTDAARALILAVSSLAGRTLGEVASRVHSLPGYNLAEFQWEAQQGETAVLGHVEVEETAEARAETLVEALEAMESVTISSQGGITMVLLKKGEAGGAGAAPRRDGAFVTRILRHRGGNQQVLLSNGQRWHLPRGKSPSDIPPSDPLGDELQAAADRVAREWGPGTEDNFERHGRRMFGQFFRMIFF